MDFIGLWLAASCAILFYGYAKEERKAQRRFLIFQKRMKFEKEMIKAVWYNV